MKLYNLERKTEDEAILLGDNQYIIAYEYHRACVPEEREEGDESFYDKGLNHIRAVIVDGNAGGCFIYAANFYLLAVMPENLNDEKHRGFYLWLEDELNRVGLFSRWANVPYFHGMEG